MNERPTNDQIMTQVAQQFLQRTDLKGNEVDSYAKCFNYLQTIVEGEFVVVPAEAWKDAQDAVTTLLNQQESEAKEADDLPVLEEDTSDGESMVSEGAPAA